MRHRNRDSQQVELYNTVASANLNVSIRLESVSKVFRHHPALFNWMGKEREGQTLALDDLSLTVPTGNTLVLLGPNGSGKTTLLKLICTMLLPDSGRILVDEADTQLASRDVRRKVSFAVATERSFFPRLSARENLDFFAALDDVPREARRERIEQLLEATGLLESADILVMKFSTGMYQRLGLARALMKDPPVLLLDEPTRSLDPAAAAHFWELIRDLPPRGHTLVVASHSFHEALTIGNLLVVLSAGKLVGRMATSSDMSVDDLRSLYFNATGEREPEMSASFGGLAR